MEAGGTTTSDKKSSVECWKTIAEAGTALHNQAYSSTASAVDSGYVNGAGTSNSCTGNAATATGVKDYGDTNKTIKIGYAGAGLTAENLNYVAGYTDNGTKIKDVSKDVLKSWIGLGNYLPLSGGTMSGQITKSTGGSWIGDRDRAAIKSSYAGDNAYGAVAGMATKNGYWTMGNLGGNESLIFNYSTDANHNAGKNETSQVYLPAQAGTIITSATIGSQSVNYANSAGNATNATNATKATTADKLGTSAGTTTQPVYFKDGKPVVIGYTIAKSVPADAKFTDTNTWRGIQDNLTSNSKDQSLSAAQGKALKTLVDGKAAAGHTHNSVKDAGNNSSNTTFAYSKSGMNYGDYSWLAGWNGYELRAINKNQFATAGHNHDSRYYTESEIDSKLDGKSNVGHTHDYLPTAGGTMNGTITFSDSSHGKIYSGPTNNVNGPGGDLNNIVIESWNGLSFTTGCPNQTYTGKTAVGIDCREGVVKAARFDGTLTGTAATLGGGGNPYAPMTFNWSGKDGQPTWLWGGEDGTNMYV